MSFLWGRILYEAIKCRFCAEFLNEDSLNEDETFEDGKTRILGLCVGLPSELPDLKQKMNSYCRDNDLKLLDAIVPKDFDKYG